MAKKGGFFDNPFGGFFDFNQDGKESLFEQVVGLELIHGTDHKDSDTHDIFGVDDSDDDTEADDSSWRDSCEDGSEYGLDPADYDTEEEYEEALEDARSETEWRTFCEDGSEYGLDPENYDTEEEYEEALEEAKAEYGESDTAAPASTENEESIQPKDYPNKRKYNAAVLLDELKSGGLIYGNDGERNRDMARCAFILNNPDLIAANYLTADGDFLYTQAIKEHFQLPFAVEDEDETQEVFLDELLEEIADVDVSLALAAWKWCGEKFFPYRQYEAFDNTLATSLLSKAEILPPELVDMLITDIQKNFSWAELLVTGCEEEAYGYAILISKLLQRGDSDHARRMMELYTGQESVKPKEIDRLFSCIIEACETETDLEAIDLVKAELLPVIQGMPLMKRKLPKYNKEINSYIERTETSEWKYAYSRRYAWRAAYKDAPPFDLDPLNYETEEEYQRAIEKEKYGWREWHEDDEKEYGIPAAQYETEDAYLAAVKAERDRRREEQEQLREEARKQQAEKYRKMKEERLLQAKQAAAESLANRDKTVYTFYGVQFPYSEKLYYFRSTDDTLDIGDKVVVQTGPEQRDTVVEIASVEKHRRATAPYPVDKAKFIVRRVEPPVEPKKD